MSLDLQTVTALRNELNEQIAGCRIEKIQQPRRDIIIMTLKSKRGEMQKLLISAGTGDARVHLTEYAFDNPAAPPMFCMLLRKHLTGAKIEAVTQPPAERILEIDLKTSNAMGDDGIRHLIIELFGRIPNIILTDCDKIIIDCLRRIGGDIDGKHMLLPGLRYQIPDNKTQQNNTASDSVPGYSISKFLDTLYTRKAIDNAAAARSAALVKTIKSAQNRIIRRLAAQKSDLLETEKRDYLRECADIIMVNLHNIKKGDEVLIAEDFYAQAGEKREIKLDPLLSAQKNAAKYYKAYSKAKNAAEHLAEQITNGEAELEYVESVIEQLSRAVSEHDIEDIRRELTETRYLRPAGDNKKKQKTQVSKPLEFKSSTGLPILAGKNNTQNDTLTLKTASKSDMWLHTQKIHGAHVIIKTGGKTVDDVTLAEAAVIAVYFSAAKEAGKVPVDYTLVRYVKKPPGARPGMVTYSEFKTIIAQADGELVMRLRI